MNLKERKAIIAGNWKLNKRVAEIPAFTQELQANLPAERCCDVVICAPYPLIAALETAGQGCHLGVGAQDVSEHQHGAFTGEVSAEQLSDLAQTRTELEMIAAIRGFKPGWVWYVLKEREERQAGFGYRRRPPAARDPLFGR